ncbi:hypothetical protein A9Q83_02365 [Alphaproteobacteria bacterium 46_93_T64]|nr:hypothetical protein A9Q83_02365 [Alphaproteobacteria bacterium 46_93_T64]
MLSNAINSPENTRDTICQHYLANEQGTVETLIKYLGLSEAERAKIGEDATEFVRLLRRQTDPGLMETFLGEYGLSTEEGVALMCLAEALLRVPDEDTIDVLIRDKIAPANWSKHLGHSTSPLVNASTWALMLTGKVISPEETANWDVVANVRHLIRRAGEPVIRKAVAQAMKVLGHQFVLGRDIKEAMARAKGMEEQGYQYSYDMLGEAARTASDASKYFLSYSKAISQLSEAAVHKQVRDNPGISVKLSALHPRYEYSQKQRVMDELVPRVASLALQAKNAGMGFNIDAEEADRLDLSLDVIEAVLSIPDFAGWDGFGVVVQAYGPRAFYVLDWCYETADRLNRKIMIRLVKGAYWDTEIKLAQVEGLSGYPVFTQKAATDISYMACAKKLLSMTDRIYPQFATHNAHTVMSVLALAGDTQDFEFQRLHGMGEALHGLAKEKYGSRCRIYAPVGIHEDLLAYLVRRLLENGANSSFVNQVFDEKVPARHVVRDPIALLQSRQNKKMKSLPLPVEIYPNGRKNAAGINFANPADLKDFYRGIDSVDEASLKLTVSDAKEIEISMNVAKEAHESWSTLPVSERAGILDAVANLYEETRDDLMNILISEAGKTPFDAINEVREAVDFCRYYAEQGRELTSENGTSCGVFVCISPWNFPLAIFTGQIVAALVAGNAVLAKPAEQTPKIAALAVSLMHQAGVPRKVLHLHLGDGSKVGQQLVSHSNVNGICFTGSTETAKKIQIALAQNGNPNAPFIAETGGLNAMIVDTTALPEQAVRDIVASAFQSAGQRCSALRILYVQEDVSEKLISMLEGAMDELVIGDPYEISTDVGPVIDSAASGSIEAYIRAMAEKDALCKTVPIPIGLEGHYVAPTLLKVAGIQEMEREVFGPVLHVATYPAGGIKQVIEAINNAGYGLTLGLHTRVDNRVEEVAAAANVGNIYVNRNQIGAVVGAQPFGGEGLSGTGPKAGGPLYLHKFMSVSSGAIDHDSVMKRVEKLEATSDDAADVLISLKKAQQSWEICPKRVDLMRIVFSKLIKEEGIDGETLEKRLLGYTSDAVQCAGPTGEKNLLTFHGRGIIGVTGSNWLYDTLIALFTGNGVVVAGPSSETTGLVKILDEVGVEKGVFAQSQFIEPAVGILEHDLLDAVCISPSTIDLRDVRRRLSARSGKITSSLQSGKSWREYVQERCLSIDTTASGGNAALLAEVDQ